MTRERTENTNVVVNNQPGLEVKEKSDNDINSAKQSAMNNQPGLEVKEKSDNDINSAKQSIMAGYNRLMDPENQNTF